ncbi:MAG: glycosyltransferase family 4 protein [Verrucomicrobiae bacterium]|nr:glycosyltransferase family 4 protein [Verrucomicrobiae bacterium]
MGRAAHVLWISCVGEKGGAEVYLLNFLRHLDRRRYRASVVLLRPGPLAGELREAGATVYEFRRHRMRNMAGVLRAVAGIRRLIREEKVDLVHANGFRAHAYGGLAARWAGVPAVWSVHAPEADRSLITRVLTRIPVAGVVANCPRTADWYAARGFEVSMVWPPVDMEHLRHRTGREVLAQRYGVPSGGRWVAMASRLQRYKGHSYLLRAVADLVLRSGDVQAVIPGGALFGMETDYLEALRGEARSLGIAGRVHFPGFVPDADLYGFMAGAEVMTHPALDEDFGLAVAEAQGLERPVVAFASVGPGAILEDRVTGRLVPVGDQAAFTGAMEEVLGMSEGERARMGRAGRERVERLFGASGGTRRLERVYEAYLGGRALRWDEWRQPVVEGEVEG